MRLIKGFALGICLLTSVEQAMADNKQVVLNELVSVMKMESMIDATYQQVEAMLQSMPAQMGIKPSEQPMFESYYSKMVDVLKAEMNWAKMEPQVLAIYERNFSEQELKDILAFYKTESGQSLVEKMPAVMQDSMQISQSLVQQAMPQIQTLAQELAAELQASRGQAE